MFGLLTITLLLLVGAVFLMPNDQKTQTVADSTLNKNDNPSDTDTNKGKSSTTTQPDSNDQLFSQLLGVSPTVTPSPTPAASSDPTPTPSPNPTSTPTPSPTPTPTPEEEVLPDGFPTDSDTGPLSPPSKTYSAADAALYGESVTGEYRITVAGTVLDGYTFDQCIGIYADNVEILNSVINCNNEISAVWVRSGTGAVIQRNTIIGTPSGVPSAAGVFCSDCTVRLNNISQTADAVKTSENSLIEYNYFGQLRGDSLPAPNGTHNDGIQFQSGDTVTIRLNTFNNDCDITTAQGGGCNTVIFMKSESGPISNITIENNFFENWSSFFIIRATNGGSAVDGIIIKDNLFSTGIGTPILCQANTTCITSGNTYVGGAAID